MEFRLLGEVELRAAGQVLDVRAPRLQAVLAALAVDAGRPVAMETLIDRVWDDTPPVEVRNVLYSYLSRIRRLLEQAARLTGGTAVRIERRHAGYVLDIDPDLVDLHRFGHLVVQGSDRQRGDDGRAAALAEALGLWRGSPLAGLPGTWAAQVRDSWDLRRLDAVVQWAQIELRLGHPAAVITTLPDLATEYPLVEPLETLLMRALHAAGRGAEALCRYSAVRRRLADELGTDPGPELRALHQAILHGELPPPPADPVVAAVRTIPPATLPSRPAASTSAVAQHGPDLAPAGGSESPTMPPDDGPGPWRRITPPPLPIPSTSRSHSRCRSGASVRSRSTHHRNGRSRG
jgi:DNA-binding SARP family transcriptional activator